MTARSKAAGILVLGIAPLALTGLAAAPALAHGSLTDPVSRVSACYAEGPENPRSAACKAAVAAGGTQALYDWNGVNIANAAGKHRDLIPDGKLCSAANDKFKGLDLPRADWPASAMSAGARTFTFRATAPHKGSFELYLTKPGYDASKPLAWSDLEAKPFASATDPVLKNGSYVFDGTVPQRSGRHLVYTVWQRSDSPEAFYACSDVTFGGGTKKEGGIGAQSVEAPTAPSEDAIAEGAAKSSVEHNGHGDDDANTGAKVTTAAPAGEGGTAAGGGDPAAPGGDAPAANAAPGGEVLAETGGSGSSAYLAVGGAAVLAAGAATLFASQRRRATATGRRGR